MGVNNQQQGVKPTNTPANNALWQIRQELADSKIETLQHYDSRIANCRKLTGNTRRQKVLATASRIVKEAEALVDYCDTQLADTSIKQGKNKLRRMRKAAAAAAKNIERLANQAAKDE